MNFKDIIDNNTLVVCNNNTKDKILSFLNDSSSLYSIKFISMQEIIRKLFFDYDEKTIYYLMHNYHLTYNVALTYIKNMYYIDDIEYKSDKLNLLVKYKKELIDNNLLIFDNLFINYIRNKKIIICERQITKYYKYIIDILSKYSDVRIYDYKYENYNHKVFEFNNIDDEIEYVAYSICDLINNGVDISNIKIANIDNNYYNSLKRIFSYFNIPLNLHTPSYLYGTKIGKTFLEHYSSDINEAIASIAKYSDNPIYNLIINICNKYSFVSNYLEVKDMIIYDLSNTLVPQPKYRNAIEVIDYKDIIEDEYVFLMNFNLSSIPKVYKDEDYLTDNIKPTFLDNTVEKNKLEKEITIKCINNIKNLVITYKNHTPTGECYPSNLVDNYTVEKVNIDIYKSYSKINDKLKLASSLDKLLKYGSKSNVLNTLKYNYDIPYMKFDNKYSGVNKDDLLKYLDNKLSLSYSTIEKYNECAFKYYISNILKLDIYEENFAAILGTLFHHILEIGITKDIDIDNEVTLFLHSKYGNRVFSKKETFFINNAKKDMQFVLDIIKRQMTLCKLNGIKTEERVYVNKDRNIKITFNGIIDKLLYQENEDNTIIAIIDYKTGNYVDIDLGYLEYGIGLQLPIYLYLASNMDFKNIKFAGIYLQKVMPDIEKIENIKESREDKLKLEGYSNSNPDIIKLFDITYQSSNIIKSLRTKNDGNFYAYSKVLSDDNFNEIINLTEKQIDKCVDDITNAHFDINPIVKEKDSDITACAFCQFKDICFRTNNDIRYLKRDKDLSYLRGEDNE